MGGKLGKHIERDCGNIGPHHGGFQNMQWIADTGHDYFRFIGCIYKKFIRSPKLFFIYFRISCRLEEPILSTFVFFVSLWFPCVCLWGLLPGRGQVFIPADFAAKIDIFPLMSQKNAVPLSEIHPAIGILDHIVINFSGSIALHGMLL